MRLNKALVMWACSVIFAAPDAVSQHSEKEQLLIAIRDRAALEYVKYDEEAKRRKLGVIGRIYEQWDSNRHRCIALSIVVGKQSSTRGVIVEKRPNLIGDLDWEEEEKNSFMRNLNIG